MMVDQNHMPLIKQSKSNDDFWWEGFKLEYPGLENLSDIRTQPTYRYGIEILSAREDKICIPKRPCNVLFII